MTMTNTQSLFSLRGAGLGFRRNLADPLAKTNLDAIDFFEVSPENWLDMGGRYRDMLAEFTSKKPFVAHGLSLSLGSHAPLDTAHLKRIKAFLDEYDIELFTEHLSWCSTEKHLYDLLPIPMNEDNVYWVAGRIRQTQELLERKIGVENASVYFTPAGSSMSEPEFVRAVVEEAGCYLHLDVNNTYVNSQNFGFDPEAFLAQLPLEHVCYIHVAGHYVEEDGFIIDTHGSEVIDPVWQLLHKTFELAPKLASTVPTCLERDFNFPEVSALLTEVEHIRRIQAAHTPKNINTLAVGGFSSSKTAGLRS